MNKFIVKIVEDCLIKDIRKFSALTGDVKELGASFDDLGDYLPTLIMFGRKDLWEKEVDKVIDYLKSNDNLFEECGKGLISKFVRCYCQTDLLWGLILASKFDSKYVSEIIKPLEKVYDSFIAGKPNFLMLKRIPVINYDIPQVIRPKIKILSSEDHGMYIEIFIKTYELTKDGRYLSLAKELGSELFDSDFFRLNGFLEFYRPQTIFSSILTKVFRQFSKRDGEFQLLKQNSNALFGVYALSKYEKKYKDLFYSTINVWIDKFYDDTKELFYTNYNTVSGEKGSDLTVFHIIELLILAGKVELAEKITRSILRNQSHNTGLIPFYHPSSEQSLKRMNARLSSSWLDSEVDFGVALVRLYEKTRDELYLNSALKVLDGIEKCHKKQYGFCAEVDYDTGEVVNPIYSAKMTGLISKLSLAIDNIDVINSQDHVYYDLLQDR